MNFEIFTYGGGDFLRMVFNALATIFAMDDFMTAIRTMAIIGLLVVMTQAAFFRGKLNFQWIIGLTAIFMVVFIPKTNVLINDRVVPANNAVVANVPLGLAAPAGFFSSFSNWLTNIFETQFSLPNEMRYTGNGMLLANKLIEAQAEFEIPDSRVSGNFAEFWRTCVYYDLLLGRYTWNDLTSQTNLFDFFAANTSVVRSFTYTNPDGSQDILVCRNGYVGNLQPDMLAQVNLAHIKHSQELINDPVPANAQAKFAAAMPVALQYYTGIAQNAVQTTNQMMLSNSLKRGLSSFATAADAPAAAQEFAMARAQAERNNTFAVMGRLAGRFLPILRNVFEALIYALSPLVMLMLMLPVAGKVAIGYLKALAWINLWGPLFAILHFVMSYYSQDAATSAVVDLGVSGLSMSTYTGLSSVLSEHSLVAGYLTVSIPMIAWLVINSGGAMMAGLAGKLMSSYDSSVSSASREASTGNMKMGEVGYDNQTAFQKNLSPVEDAGRMHTYDSATGMMNMTDMGGHYASQQMLSNFGTSLNMGQSVQNVARESLAESQSLASSTTASLIQATGTAESSALSVGSRVTEGQDHGMSVSSTETAAFKTAIASHDRMVDQWMDQNSITHSEVSSMMASVGIETKVGTPGGGLIGSSAAVVGKAAAEGRLSEDHKETFSKIQQLVSSDEYQKSVEQVGQAARQLSASYSGGTQDQRTDSLDTSFNNLDSAQDANTVALQKVEQATKQMDYVEQASMQISVKGEEGLMEYTSAAGIPREHMRELYDRANRNDNEAQAELMGYMNSYAKDQLSSYSETQANYELDSASIQSRGEQAVGSHSNNSNAEVGSVNEWNRNYVESQSSVKSSDEMKEVIRRADDSASENLSNPAGALAANTDPNALNLSNNEKVKEMEDKKAEMDQEHERLEYNAGKVSGRVGEKETIEERQRKDEEDLRIRRLERSHAWN